MANNNNTVSSLDLYNAARQAIYDIIVDGKASASFNGRSYTANDIEKLRKAEAFYKSEAIKNGELAGVHDTSVSYPYFPEGGMPIC